ncbi:MAG: Rpp14/Pop5 family protein [Candidatus Asgardarchaeia archaeon]
MVRERRRYIAFNVMGKKLNTREVVSNIIRTYIELFGEYGLSRSSLRLISYDEEKGVGIIRCSLDTLRKTEAVLSSIYKIGQKEEKVRFSVLGVSGTIKSCIKNFLKGAEF